MQQAHNSQVKKNANAAAQARTIASIASHSTKLLGSSSLTSDQQKALSYFIESFASVTDCFEYIDMANKGYILGADWTCAIQRRLSQSPEKMPKIKTIEAFAQFAYLCKLISKQSSSLAPVRSLDCQQFTTAVASWIDLRVAKAELNAVKKQLSKYQSTAQMKVTPCYPQKCGQETKIQRPIRLKIKPSVASPNLLKVKQLKSSKSLLTQSQPIQTLKLRLRQGSSLESANPPVQEVTQQDAAAEVKIEDIKGPVDTNQVLYQKTEYRNRKMSCDSKIPREVPSNESESARRSSQIIQPGFKLISPSSMDRQRQERSPSQQVILGFSPRCQDDKKSLRIQGAYQETSPTREDQTTNLTKMRQSAQDFHNIQSQSLKPVLSSRVFSPTRQNNYLELHESKNISFLLSEQQGTGGASYAATVAPQVVSNKDQKSYVAPTEEPVLVECSQIEQISDICSVAIKTDQGDEDTLANALEDACSKAQPAYQVSSVPTSKFPQRLCAPSKGSKDADDSETLARPINKKLSRIITSIQKETSNAKKEFIKQRLNIEMHSKEFEHRRKNSQVGKVPQQPQTTSHPLKSSQSPLRHLDVGKNLEIESRNRVDFFSPIQSLDTGNHLFNREFLQQSEGRLSKVEARTNLFSPSCLHRQGLQTTHLKQPDFDHQHYGNTLNARDNPRTEHTKFKNQATVHQYESKAINRIISFESLSQRRSSLFDETSASRHRPLKASGVKPAHTILSQSPENRDLKSKNIIKQTSMHKMKQPEESAALSQLKQYSKMSALRNYPNSQATSLANLQAFFHVQSSASVENLDKEQQGIVTFNTAQSCAKPRSTFHEQSDYGHRPTTKVDQRDPYQVSTVMNNYMVQSPPQNATPAQKSQQQLSLHQYNTTKNSSRHLDSQLNHQHHKRQMQLSPVNKRRSTFLK